MSEIRKIYQKWYSKNLKESIQGHSSIFKGNSNNHVFDVFNSFFGKIDENLVNTLRQL